MTETATLTLSDFLLARIAEDEEAARAAMPGPWFSTEHELWASPIVCEDHWPGLTEKEAEEYNEVPGAPHYVVAQTMHGGQKLADAAHIARWDPARVLAECEAKRRIVEMHSASGETDGAYFCNWDNYVWPCDTLCVLAQPYADHPDFREEWRV